MSECSHVDFCPYANLILPKNEELSKKYADNYCFGDFDSCARLKVFNALGKPNVPQDLYPDQFEVAECLIKQINSSC